MILMNDAWKTKWNELVCEWMIRSGKRERLVWCKAMWREWRLYTRDDPKELRLQKLNTLWNICMDVIDGRSNGFMI